MRPQRTPSYTSPVDQGRVDLHQSLSNLNWLRTMSKTGGPPHQASRSSPLSASTATATITTAASHHPISSTEQQGHGIKQEIDLAVEEEVMAETQPTTDADMLPAAPPSKKESSDTISNISRSPSTSVTIQPPYQHHANVELATAPSSPVQSECSEASSTSASTSDDELMLNLRQTQLELLRRFPNSSLDEYLTNTDSRPPYAYATIIFMAMTCSGSKRLQIADIYNAIMSQWDYYRDRPEETGWKNSIRHNLTICRCFQKVMRQDADGKGGYWEIDDALAKVDVSMRPRDNLISKCKKNKLMNKNKRKGSKSVSHAGKTIQKYSNNKRKTSSSQSNRLTAAVSKKIQQQQQQQQWQQQQQVATAKNNDEQPLTNLNDMDVDEQLWNSSSSSSCFIDGDNLVSADPTTSVDEFFSDPTESAFPTQLFEALLEDVTGGSKSDDIITSGAPAFSSSANGHSSCVVLPRTIGSVPASPLNQSFNLSGSAFNMSFSRFMDHSDQLSLSMSVA